jgi:hypothetical protein
MHGVGELVKRRILAGMRFQISRLHLGARGRFLEWVKRFLPLAIRRFGLLQPLQVLPRPRPVRRFNFALASYACLSHLMPLTPVTVNYKILYCVTETLIIVEDNG